MKKILLLFCAMLVTITMFAQAPPFYSTPGGTSNNSFPFNTTSSNQVQWIYGPGEFSSTGGGTGTPAYIGLIDTIWVRLTSASANFSAGFEISLGQNVGTQSTWTSATWTTGLTSVIGPGPFNMATQAVSYSGVAQGSGFWVGIPLTTPFLYNPSLSLVVECRQSGYTSGTTTPQFSSNGNRRIWGPYGSTPAGSNFGSGQANIGLSLLSPLTCSTPTNGSASNITQTSIQLNWTENNSPAATTWQIEYGPSGFTPTGTPQITTTNNPHTITGLTQNTAYDFHVRSYCGPNDSSYYFPILGVTTLATCPWPTNLQANNVTNSSADLDWTENGSATIWDIEIGLSGFTPTGTPVIPGVTTKPFNLPGLPSNTCFDYYVRAACGGTNGNSVWTGPYTFCTTIAPLNCTAGNPGIVFQESFDNTFTGQTNIPNAAAPGWTNTATANPRWALESNGTGSASTGPSAGAPGGSNNGYAYLEVSCVNGGSDTLTSPIIDLTGIVGAARVKWFNHMYGPNSGKLEVFVDNGSTLTSIYVDSGQTHTTDNVSIDPWDSVVVSLNAFVGQSIQLRFVGTAANPGGCSGDRGLDQIEVEGCVACAAPSNFTVIGASSTSVTVGWTDNNTPTSGSWDIEAVPTGGTPTGTPTVTGVTTNPYTVTGLTPFAAYDFYVRANCGGSSGSSSWAGFATASACAPLAGVYTVDPALPVSATNFQTLGAVASALNCGVSAPVVFNLAPGNTFNEQVIFPEVVGASATNTITINGNGDTVTALTNATDYHVIRLFGSDYFRFNDLTVVSTSSTNAMAMHLLGGTNHNEFRNCTFAVPLAATSSLTSTFALSGSATSPSTQMVAEADSNIIDSCKFIGSYWQVCLAHGPASGSNGNQVTNSTFEDFYVYGTYFINGDDLYCAGNEFSRPNRTTITTCYGLYATGVMSNSVFEKNWIHDPAGASPTASFTGYFIYMLQDAIDSANANIVQNNIIEDNQGNGTHYGIYLNNAYNIKCYNNTIIHNNQTAGQTGVTRGIFQAGTSTLLGLQDIQNNVISITRNTTGQSIGIYLQANPVTCDYNNVYGNTSNYLYGFNGANQIDLAAWQASTPTVGQNSIAVDPLFVLPAPNQYLPTNAGMNNQANPALGVTEDFSGAVRSATPDMGALEFTVSSTDIATTAILSPDPSVGCYSANDTVVVEISNFGATAHDFSANPTTVTAQVTGTITATLTATVNSGTLPSLGTLAVTMSPTVNMTAAGAYTITAYSTTVGDPVAFNDTLATPNTYNVNLVPGTISASPDIICASGTTDVTISGNAGGFIQWQTSPTGTGPWTNVGSGTNPYNSPVITSNTFYRALLTCNANIDSTNVDTVIVNNPVIGTTISDTICGADTVTLVAQAVDTSANVNWYDVPTGGTALAMGDTLKTFISGTDTFYASALVGDPNSILITEICNFNNATGWATPIAPVPSAITDPIEFTNIGSAPVDMSGWQVQVVGGSAGTWTFPSGAVVAPNSTVVISRGSSAPDVPGQYYTSTLPASSSGTALGVILSNGTQVIDVASYNGYAVVGQGSPAATVLDWSGSMPSPSGTAGIRRTAVDDNNSASDWTVASTSNLTNYGAVNVAFTPSGCEGTRTAVVAVSTPGPTVVASATDTLVCVGDSTMLMASGAGPGGTYAWNNGGVTGVNFVPAVSPTTYTLTGTDSSGCSSIDSVTIVKADPFSGIATASPDIHCLSGTSVLDVVSGAAIQWQESNSPTGPWSNVGTNSTTYTTGTLTSTTYYRALSTCKTNVDTSTVDTVIVLNPSILSTMGDTVCGPNSANLSATASAGATVSWFSSPSGGSAINTGNMFATPTLFVTDTFYAAAVQGNAASGACGTDPSPLLINKVDVGAPDYIELVNVSSSPIDFTGWKVATSDAYGTLNPANAIINTISGTIAAGGYVGWSDATNNIPYTYWGNNLFYNPGPWPTYSAWVLLLDPCNNVRDAVIVNFDSTTIATGSITLTGIGTISTSALWSGPGASGLQNGIERVGSADNDNASDFVSTVSTVPGSNNSGLILPFQFGCEGAPRTPVVAIVNPSSGDLALTTSSNASSTPGQDSLMNNQMLGQNLSYFNPSCELIATVNDNVNTGLGMVNAKVNVDATVNVWNGQPYARRWYDINVQNNGPATVTLYYTQADFDDYNAHPSVVAQTYDSLPTGPASPTANIRVTQISGGGLGLGTVTGVITPTTTWNAVASRWEMTFPVTGFSQFFLHSANGLNAALPVVLRNFTVVKNGSVSDASWNTMSEQNNSHFNVQRSLNGSDFTTLGRVNSQATNGNSITKLSYAFTDNAPQVGHNYYRLEQVDRDGKASYSQIVDLVWGADGSVVSIYPNPATDKLNVDVSIDKVTVMEVRLLDMSGRVVKSVMQQTQKGLNNISLDLSEVANGVYGVQLYDNNALIHTTKVNKQSK